MRGCVPVTSRRMNERSLLGTARRAISMGFAGVPNPMLWKIAVGAVAMAGLAILALIRYFVAGRWLEGIVLFGVFSLGSIRVRRIPGCRDPRGSPIRVRRTRLTAAVCAVLALSSGGLSLPFMGGPAGSARMAGGVSRRGAPRKVG